MKNRDIYELALAFLAENGDRAENADYEERAGYLLSAFATEILEVNRIFSESVNDEAIRAVPLYMALDEAFPMHDRFAAAAGMYLAAMLVLSEDSELSDKLFSRYCDAMSSAVSEIPMVSGKTVDRYGL